MAKRPTVGHRGGEGRPSVKLRQTYILALSLIALLTLSSQIVIHIALLGHRNDSAVINLAGRQRMLSQLMTKCALMMHYHQHEPDTVEFYLAQLSQAHERWQSRHLGLKIGMLDSIGTFHNSTDINALFSKCQPHFEAIDEACSRIVLSGLGAFPPALHQVLEHEPQYLQVMDAITFQYDRESKAKVTRIQIIELTIFFVILLVLYLEVRFVFAPAARKIDEFMKIIQEQARELVANTIVVQEKERKRISKDLHDGIGSSLAVLRLRLSQMENECPDAYRHKLEGLSEYVNEVASEVRNLAEDMMPLSLERFGLETALGELVSTAQEVFSGEIETDISLEREQSADVQINIYRILQELLSNSLRHSGANHVYVQIQADEAKTELLYEDNGCGLNDDFKPGHGFANIETRAGALNADWSFANKEPSGFRMALSFAC